MNFQNQIDYGQYYNIDVLGGVPELPPLNLDTLKSHIMLRCGLLFPLYSEPSTMRDAIAHWFQYMDYDIKKMLALAETEYLPLENFRRNESESSSGSDVTNHTGTISDSGGETIEDDGTITDDYESERERQVSAYNEDEYSPSEKENVRDGNNTREIDTSREITRGNTRTFLNSDSNTQSGTKTRLYYGNIGTMTSQEMFNQELDLLAKFNPYDWIVDRIEADLFLGLW